MKTGRPSVDLDSTGDDFSTGGLDKAQFADHWTKDLEIWFKEGVDTPGLTLIKVHGERAHYWDGEDQGDLVLGGAHADTVANATG